MLERPAGILGGKYGGADKAQRPPVRLATRGHTGGSIASAKVIAGRIVVRRRASLDVLASPTLAWGGEARNPSHYQRNRCGPKSAS